MTERLLTPEEVAHMLQISRLTVMDYLRRGILTGIKVGRLWRIREEDLQSFLGYEPESDVPLVSDSRAKDYLDEDSSNEDSRWLECELESPLPPFDWGPSGVPNVRPVRYVPGVGLVIKGESPRGQ